MLPFHPRQPIPSLDILHVPDAPLLAVHVARPPPPHMPNVSQVRLIPAARLVLQVLLHIALPALKQPAHLRPAKVL